MFAINHAATALIFKRRFEDVSLVALLLSVAPKKALAGHPLTLVTVILVQIVITMWAVWWGVSHAERLSGLGFVER